MTVPELNPTKLGTKEHWDSVYDDEFKNFKDSGEEGEIWFGEETVEKMVKWGLANVPPSSNASILEAGCGNGTLLLGLLDAGYSGTTLHGIDYSEGAITLAKGVAESRGGSGITYSCSDFLQDDPPAPRNGQGVDSKWDLIMDKGTYDAIALGEKDEHGHSPAIRYPGRVARLLKPGGFFLITSCNFTEEELKESFLSEDIGLEYHSHIKHRVYTFGGKSGSICSSVAFKKS